MVLGTFLSLIGAICVTCLSSDTPTWAVPLLIPFCSIGQGFFYPATTIAVLALNSQAEQAVVTTTLGLVRNLGAILGVAISSWLLQNALLVYLDRGVTGPDKDRIIRTVRESVGSIRRLDPEQRKQVIEAYAQSLRVTFGLAILISVVCILLIWPVHIPHLQRQEELDRQSSGLVAPADVDEAETEESEEEDEIEEEVAPLSISRTMSRRSRTTASSLAGSAPGGTLHDLERRPSFDTSW